MSKVVPYPPQKQNSCTIQITCSEPSECGNMDVEMVIEGNECLAAMLIEYAQKLLDERNI